MEFKYKIGDSVASEIHIKELNMLMNHAGVVNMRPVSMRVEERISIECVAGTQLFYGCRCWDGVVQKHPETMLVPAETLWNVWLDCIHAQDAKKSKL